MARTNNYIWMSVTRDEYELPLDIADSAPELASIVGVDSGTIYATVFRAEKQGKKARFVRVPVEELQ